MIFKNNMVWLDTQENSNKKIIVGEWDVPDVGLEYYSSMSIDLPIAKISELRPDGLGKFRYATDFPDYRKRPELVNKKKEDYTIVYLDFENLNGVSKNNIKNRQITAISYTAEYIKNVIRVTAETELQELRKLIASMNKDNIMIVGWNIEYDYELLKGRYEYLSGHRFPDLKCVMVDLQSVYCKFVESSPTRKYRKLQDALIEQGLEGKIDYEGTLDTLLQNDPEKYFEYAQRDTVVLQELDKKCGLTDLMFEICKITGCLLQDTMANSRIHETFIYNYLKERGYVFCNRKYIDDEKTDYQGATVFEPQIGVHRGVRCYDFNSLYPYTIINWNLCPTTMCEPNTKGAKETPIGTWVDMTKKGILPELIQTLLDKRQEERSKGNHITQLVYKILANSLYGVFGNKYFRLSSVDLASTITGCARHLINSISRYVDEVFEVTDNTLTLYGDTDSLFLNADDDDVETIINDYLIPQYYTDMGLEYTDKTMFKVKDEYGSIDIIFFPIKKTYVLKKQDGSFVYKNISKSNRITMAMEYFKLISEAVLDGDIKTSDEVLEMNKEFLESFEYTKDWLSPYAIKKPLTDYKNKQPFMQGLEEFLKLYPKYNQDMNTGIILNCLGDQRISKKTGKPLKGREEIYLAVPDGLNPREVLIKSGYDLNEDYYRKSLLSMIHHFNPVLGGECV